MSFLHGVETVTVLGGPIPVNEVASAIIGVIGTAGTGQPGVLHLTRSYDEAEALYGSDGTLLAAFKAIHDHVESSTVISINVGADGVATAADVVTAMATFEEAFSRWGFFPKILIAPGFSYETTVGAELISVAGKIGAIALIDAPVGVTAEDAVTFKQTFNSKRALVCCPQVQVAGADGNLTLDWFSSRLAGLIAQVDKNQTDYSGQTGYWCSPSNYVLQGVVGVETVFPYNPKDTDSAVNYMNSQGVVTMLNFNGSGYRSWGNRSTAFPAASDPMTFIAWQRTIDIIEESITYFTLQFLDKPMFTRPGELATTLIGQVELSVNDFIRSRIGTALVAGRCYLSVEDNPVSQLANGHITFNLEATPPAPMERVTHKLHVDIAKLATVFADLVGVNMAAVSWRKNRVWVNKVDYIGQILEATTELKREMTELKGMGMPGPARVPSGNFEAATAKIKFGSIAPKDIRSIINKDGYVDVTFSGECLGLDSLVGTVKESAMTTTLRGYSEDIPGQDSNNEGTSEREITINLMFIEMKDKDGVILMIDWAKGLVKPETLA